MRQGPWLILAQALQAEVTPLFSESKPSTAETLQRSLPRCPNHIAAYSVTEGPAAQAASLAPVFTRDSKPCGSGELCLCGIWLTSPTLAAVTAAWCFQGSNPGRGEE